MGDVGIFSRRWHMKTDPFTILIVEDDSNDQLLIVDAFRKVGINAPIQVVGDGVEAIAYLNGDGKYADRTKYQYPTFVMTDLKMPKMNGFEVLQNIKRNPLWAIIPTVVFSASADLNDIQQAYRLGASSYHVKPTSSEELRKQLKLLYDYWMTCEVPQVDSTGKQVETKSHGKLGPGVPEQPPDDDDSARR